MKKFLFTFSSLCLFAVASMAQFDGLVINEFVASNDSIGGYQEPDGGFGDWVELFNNGSATINLEGVNFSDDLAELDKWAFPAGTTITGGGYLIVWTDDDEGQTGIHTNFRLGRSGEDLVLSTNGTIIDQHTFGEQETNVAEARIPNGTGNFVAQEPTPNGNNEVLGTRAPATLRLAAYPNPTSNTLTITLGDSSFDRYEIINLVGNVVMTGTFKSKNEELLLDVSGLASGQYQLIFDEGKAASSFTRQ